MIIKQPNCNDLFEAGLISVEKALEKILSQISPLTDYQCLSIENACHRVLSEEIRAPFNVPRQNNSAVDGYAIQSGDIPSHGDKQLVLCGKIFAGEQTEKLIQPGQCVRIMTGAVIPAGADTVLMQEQVKRLDQEIIIDSQHHSGENIRLAGEDLKQGDLILHPGRYLTPADIGLLASMGIAEIKVKRKLRIAIASTGDELVGIGQQAGKGNIYDSNRYTLQAMLGRADIEIINMGIIEDNPDTLLHHFEIAGQYADLIISSGGVSVGEADHTKTALQASGRIDFWKIAVKPGRPMAFGQLGNSLFFGLPGNPVAVMVTFYLFVKPAIEKMLGIADTLITPTMSVRTIEDIRKKPGRTEIVRGKLYQDSNAEWRVKTTGKQGSGILRSMSQANAFIILEHHRGWVEAGDFVMVQPFAGFI